MHHGSHSNGTLTLGGVDTRLSDGPIAYVPDSSARGFHSVDVGTFKLSHAVVDAAAPAARAARAAPVRAPVSVPVNAAAILDTGTNVLLLPPALLAALGEAMCADPSLAQCAALWANECVELTAAEAGSCPNSNPNPHPSPRPSPNPNLS